MTMKKYLFVVFILSASGFSAAAQKDYNILSFGAKPGLDQENTAAIQKAIDAAAGKGRGRVVIPAGNFVTGPLVLKSGVELHLQNNAVLLGSAKRMSYTDGKMSVISAKDQHDISITGKGIIDGQGRDLVENALLLLRQGKIQDKEWLLKRPTEKNRPNLVYLIACKRVKVTGITLKNAACWVQNYTECDGVVIDSMTVHSTAYWNNDGIDIVDSRNVTISNSYFNASDDAICLKSESATGSCENIRIENCTLRSSASGFKLGTGSIGGFKNITVKNLTVFDTYRSAIALETVDGAYLENIDIRHVRAKNTGNAIFIRLGHRNKDERYSSLRNVFIDDVKVEVPSGKPDIGYPMEGPPPKVPAHNLIPSSITGLAGHPVQNVTIQNVEIIYGGGGKKEVAYISTDALGTVPENAAGYPEFTMFGEIPAWGFYIRHAEGIKLSNIKLSYQQEDYRPALIADDVNGLTLNDITVPATVSPSVIVLKGTGNAVMNNLQLAGKGKEGILVQK
jgi:polygalacturonase